MKRSSGLAVFVVVASLIGVSSPSRGEDAVVSYKSLAPDAALDLAKAALAACRGRGYQVAVVVLDRFGQKLVLLRDRYAGLPAPDTASDKAYTALSFRMSSGDFAKAIQGGQLSAGLAKLAHIVTLTGGLVIEAGGNVLGAVGVAGAPGGDKDEDCAKAGLDAIRDKLDFCPGLAHTGLVPHRSQRKGSPELSTCAGLRCVPLRSSPARASVSYCCWRSLARLAPTTSKAFIAAATSPC